MRYGGAVAIDAIDDDAVSLTATTYRALFREGSHISCVWLVDRRAKELQGVYGADRVDVHLADLGDRTAPLKLVKPPAKNFFARLACSLFISNHKVFANI